MLPLTSRSCLNYCLQSDQLLCAGHTWRLLQNRGRQQPTLAMTDFWHTVSGRLTQLALNPNWSYHDENLLQPQLIQQLTALTKMSFHVTKGYGAGYSSAGDTLELPELKVLHVENYCGSFLFLDCPKLIRLTLVECSCLKCMFLQAPLQSCSTRSSGGLRLHDGFPVSNLMELVSLTVQCPKDVEEKLSSVLPLMQNLQTLDLGINQGMLLQGLPHSLREVSLEFTNAKDWDNALIPVLQQLTDLRDLKISIRWDCADAPAMLSCDLMPFLAMPKLRTFQLGPWKAWTPSSFNALWQFEVELARSGSNLKLIY